MKTWKKGGIGVADAAVLGGIVLYSVKQANKGVVTVQTSNAQPQDLTSQVTASGEIKPRDYSNVLGEGIGKITQIVVKEGDQVRKGDVLLRLENIQPGADVQAQIAALDSSVAGVTSADANYKAAHADLAQRKADLERAKLDWERGQGLFKDGLIPKSDYDTRKAAYDSAVAAADASSARILQLQAEIRRARTPNYPNNAMLTRTKDVLRKTTYTAPINRVGTFIRLPLAQNREPRPPNAPR